MEKAKHAPLLIAIVFAVITAFPLLNKGLLPTHDGEYHVIRFYEFDKTLRGGDWYPRWAPDLNYGHGIPLFNYVYPLPNYVASLLHFLGASFIDAFKINMFIATILGAIFFYLWTRIFWGNIGGAISSVFYTLSPYHLVDIYIRGSVGEVWALALFPGFLWGLTMLINTQKKIFMILSGAFFAAIIFSHNILGLMFVPFALSYALLLLYQKKNIKKLLIYVLVTFFWGVGLSAIFWLPALLEKQYVTGLQIFTIADNFPEIYQLLLPSWGSGFSNGSIQNQMSLLFFCG